MKPGETLLVLGASGGVGLAAVEIGKAMGARVIAGASSDEKLAFARAHGAAETINTATEDLRARLKELAPKGVDVVYDPVGGALTEMALRSLAWKGRLLVIGFASGEIPKPPLNIPLLKGCDIRGVYWGEFTAREPEAHRQNMLQLMDWAKSGVFERPYPRPIPAGRFSEGVRGDRQAPDARQNAASPRRGLASTLLARVELRPRAARRRGRARPRIDQSA